MKKVLLLAALALTGFAAKADLIEGYVDRDTWTVTACSVENDEGPIANMFDGNLNTYYHQAWSSGDVRGTHWFIIDLGSEQKLKGLDIWGRQGNNNGHILEGKVYVSTTAFEAFADHDAAKAYYDNAENVAAGEIHYTLSDATRNDVQQVRFDEVNARYVMVVTDQTSNNQLCVAEVQVLGMLPHRIDLDRSGWTATACSEAGSLEGAVSGRISAMFDDNLSTYYHQNWSGDKANDAYHWFMIDLGKEEFIDGFKYWRRQGTDANAANGQFLNGKVYVSKDPFTAFDTHNGDENDAKTFYDDAANVAAGEFTFTYDEFPNAKRVCTFDKTAKGRYVLVILSNAGTNSQGRHLCCAEFKLFMELNAATLPTAWEESIDHSLVTKANNLQALGSFLGHGEIPSVEMPADLTLANFDEKIAAANAALQSYVNWFSGKHIYLRNNRRNGGQAHLAAVPTGNGVKLNTLNGTKPDAIWTIGLLEEGFYLYNRTTATFINNSNGPVAATTANVVVLTSRLNGEYLEIANGTNYNQLFNVDTQGSNLVWYGRDAGSNWIPTLASLDEQVYDEPEVSTADAPKYYRIINARWMYNGGSSLSASNMAVNGENQNGNGEGEANNRATASVPGIYWRLEADGDGVKLVNLTGYKLTSNGGANSTLTTDGSTLYVIKQTADQFHGVNAYAISNANPQTGSSCLDVDGANSKFVWSPSRENHGNGNNGSAWYFLLASDQEVATATATYIAGVKGRIIEADPTLAALFGDEFYEAVTEHAYKGEKTIPAYNKAKASGNYAATAENKAAIKEMVEAKVPELAGRHFQVRNCNTTYSNCYLTVASDEAGENFTTAPTANASDVNAIWSFVPSDEGYLMTSAATGKSVSVTNTQSAPIPVVDEGLPYSITYNVNIPGFAFTLVPTDAITNVRYYAVHQSNNNNVCKWETGDITGSHWMLEPVVGEAGVSVAPLAVVTDGHCITLPQGVEVNTHESAANLVMTISRMAAEQGARLVAPVDGVHSIKASDFVGNTVELQGLEEGKYTLEAPAGMFVVNGKPSAALTHSFAVHSDGSTTGVEEISVASEGVQVIFDLQGRRLSAPVKGVNIINGKKVLVK